MTVIDANIVLRYLLDDVEEQSDRAAALIEEGPVLVPIEVLAEVVYVLRGVYDVERRAIAESLLRLTDARTVRTPEPEVVRHALSCFAETSLDFVDCLLAGRARNGASVATFDRALEKALEDAGNTGP
jgi:predicted nucleic-acid-binding protein